LGVVENLKDAALFAQKVGQIELYKKILQAEDEVRDLTREKRGLEDKVEELEQKLKLRNAMRFEPPVYYQEGDKTPFCSSCFEGKEQRPVHLTRSADGWRCTVCKNEFPDDPDDNVPAFDIVPMGRG
jgi:hypothetical protein